MRNDNVKCTQSVLVKVQDLKKYFDVSPSLLTRVVERKPRALLKAVDGVSFEIRRGETLALVAFFPSAFTSSSKITFILCFPPDIPDL